MDMLDLTQRQVFYALDTPTTPKKSTGKPLILDAEQRAHLVKFICRLKKNRHMSYKELAEEFRIGRPGIKQLRVLLI